MRKNLIKIPLCLLAGIGVVALIPELRALTWAWFAVPLYALGTIYGIGSLGPKLWKLISGAAEKIFMTVVMKSPVGCVIMLLFLPIALVVHLTIGWFSGMIAMVQGLREDLQGQGGGLIAAIVEWLGNMRPKKGYDFDPLPLDEDAPMLPPEDFHEDFDPTGDDGDEALDTDATDIDEEDYGFQPYNDDF